MKPHKMDVGWALVAAAIIIAALGIWRRTYAFAIGFAGILILVWAMRWAQNRK